MCLILGCAFVVFVCSFSPSSLNGLYLIQRYWYCAEYRYKANEMQLASNQKCKRIAFML